MLVVVALFLVSTLPTGLVVWDTYLYNVTNKTLPVSSNDQVNDIFIMDARNDAFRTNISLEYISKYGTFPSRAIVVSASSNNGNGYLGGLSIINASNGQLYMDFNASTDGSSGFASFLGSSPNSIGGYIDNILYLGSSLGIHEVNFATGNLTLWNFSGVYQYGGGNLSLRNNQSNFSAQVGSSRLAATNFGPNSDEAMSCAKVGNDPICVIIYTPGATSHFEVLNMTNHSIIANSSMASSGLVKILPNGRIFATDTATQNWIKIHPNSTTAGKEFEFRYNNTLVDTFGSLAVNPSNNYTYLFITRGASTVTIYGFNDTAGNLTDSSGRFNLNASNVLSLEAATTIGDLVILPNNNSLVASVKDFNNVLESAIYHINLTTNLSYRIIGRNATRYINTSGHKYAGVYFSFDNQSSGSNPTVPVDLLGHGNSITNTTGPLNYTNARVGQGLIFNDTGTQVNISYSSSIDLAKENFTIQFWFNVSSNLNGDALVLLGGGNNTHGWQIEVSKTFGLKWRQRNGTDERNISIMTAGSGVSPGRWYFMTVVREFNTSNSDAGVRNNATMRFYFNNTLHLTNGTTPLMNISNGVNGITIGRDAYSTRPANLTVIDELRIISNASLNATEIDQSYKGYLPINDLAYRLPKYLGWGELDVFSLSKDQNIYAMGDSNNAVGAQSIYNFSANESVAAAAAAATPAASSGGGSGSAPTVGVTTSKGVNKLYSVGNKALETFGKIGARLTLHDMPRVGTHIIQYLSADADNKEISILVESTPQTFKVKEGETVKVDLNDNKYYDLAITLVKFTSATNVDIEIQTLDGNERVVEPPKESAKKVAEAPSESEDVEAVEGEPIIDTPIIQATVQETPLFFFNLSGEAASLVILALFALVCTMVVLLWKKRTSDSGDVFKSK
jgi:hypothetical protein